MEPVWRNQDWVMEKAQAALKAPVLHITDLVSSRSEGGPHDYYSNGDYWWPNPDTEDGLPYIQRDGQTNPDNFNGHRIIMRQMRTNVVHLTSAYVLTGEELYADRAVTHLKEFFWIKKPIWRLIFSTPKPFWGSVPGGASGLLTRSIWWMWYSVLNI